MFRCVFMTFTLHVHDLFDEMFVMVRMGQVKFLIKFYIKGLVSMLFIISDSFFELWVVVWRLALNKFLESHCQMHRTK